MEHRHSDSERCVLQVLEEHRRLSSVPPTLVRQGVPATAWKCEERIVGVRLSAVRRPMYRPSWKRVSSMPNNATNASANRRQGLDACRHSRTRRSAPRDSRRASRPWAVRARVAGQRHTFAVLRVGKRRGRPGTPISGRKCRPHPPPRAAEKPSGLRNSKPRPSPAIGSRSATVGQLGRGADGGFDQPMAGLVVIWAIRPSRSCPC